MGYVHGCHGYQLLVGHDLDFHRPCSLRQSLKMCARWPNFVTLLPRSSLEHLKGVQNEPC